MPELKVAPKESGRKTISVKNSDWKRLNKLADIHDAYIQDVVTALLNYYQEAEGVNLDDLDS